MVGGQSLERDLRHDIVAVECKLLRRLHPCICCHVQADIGEVHIMLGGTFARMVSRTSFRGFYDFRSGYHEARRYIANVPPTEVVPETGASSGSFHGHQSTLRWTPLQHFLCLTETFQLIFSANRDFVHPKRTELIPNREPSFLANMISLRSIRSHPSVCAKAARHKAANELSLRSSSVLDVFQTK